MEVFTMSDSFQEKIKRPTQSQPLLFDNRILISFFGAFTYESTKLLKRGVNDYGLEVSITFKHLRLADLLMD
jgi:hypothetical protein